MELEDALNIIGMVSDGLNPYRKCSSSSDDIDGLPENNPVTIRAICTAIISLVSKKDRDNLVSSYISKCPEEIKELVSGPLREALGTNKPLFNTEPIETDATHIVETDKEKALIEWIKEVLSTQGSENLFELLIDKFSSNIITEALRITKGNRSKAAQLLGLSRPTLHSKLEKYSID